MSATQSVGPIHTFEHVNSMLDLGYPNPVIRRYGRPPEALPQFVTFCDLHWNILHLRDIVAGKVPIFLSPDWCHEAFANLVEPPCRYRQLRMDVVPDSLGKTYDEQQAMLPACEAVPTARVVIMGMVVHFLATGQRLFSDCYVRCHDHMSDGRRIYVGCFDSEGLYVNSCWDDHLLGIVGLASARKL